MPRIVDHDRRRRELADAVLRVVSRGGFEAASIRGIAAEAGWSVGAVRHYFGSVGELLHFAFERLAEGVGARLSAVETSGRAADEVARAMLEVVVPLDEERYAEQRLWLELVVRSRHDPTLRPALDESIDALNWIARRAVALLRGIDHPDMRHPFADPALEQLALDLGVYVDGLWFRGISYPAMTPALLRDGLSRAVRHVQTARLPTAT